MTPTTAQRDPRSIITPDAFQVAPELLGLRLASPRRRLAAFVMDLMVIGLVTAVTRSFALILGVVAAVLFIRAGFRRTPILGSAFGRAMRASVGCLGLVIAVVTATLWVSFGPSADRREDEEGGGGVTVSGEPGSGTVGRVLGTVAGVAVGAVFEEARTLADAERAAREIIEASGELGIAPGELRGVLMAAVPEDAPWADEAPALFDRLLPPVGEPIESRDAAAVADEVSMYSTEEALEAYAALLRSGRSGGMDLARRAVLEARLATEIAADTLRELTVRIADLEEEVDEQEEELEEATSRGLFGTLRTFLDELGFGFGWASLYLTVTLSWWKGQTVGKRAFRIRVLRLDGGPITWWVAFERAGGYAAGLATGLLGFAQVFWDANRQAIHDRIVGTVVVRDPPEKVLDWESVL